MALETISTTPEAADTGSVSVKAPQTKGGLSLQGNIALDPTQTESILQNMQRIIEERESPLNKLVGGLKDAYATTYGPSAMIAREREKNLQEKETMDYRTQMAAYRAAQAQAADQAKRYASLNQPAAGGAGGTMDPSGVMVPQSQLDREATLGTAAEKLAARQDFLKTYTNESIKKQFSPEMDKIVQFPVNGRMVDMTLRQAVQLAQQNPNLPQSQAILRQATPSAAAVPSAPAAAQPTAVPLEGLPDPFYAQESSSGKADTSKPGIQGAQGPMQVTQDTFETYKKKGIIPASYDLNDPGHAYASGILILNDLHKKHNQDINKVAAEYFGGPGAINDDGTINVGRKDANGKTVGSYINDIRSRMGLPKVEFSSAQATVKPTTVSEQPTSTEIKAAQDVEAAGRGEFAKGVEKENAAKATQIDTVGLTAPERKTRYTDVLNIANDEEVKKYLGMLAKPGTSAFILRQLESGAGIGQFGTINIAELEKNLQEAKAPKHVIDKLRKMDKHLKAAELEYAQVYLKGQGAVSDNERKLVQEAVGSRVKDPAAVLQMQAQVMAERADFDDRMYQAYNRYRDQAGEYAPFSKFMRSPEAVSIINQHKKDLGAIIGRDLSNLGDPFKAKASGDYEPGKIKWEVRNR